MRISASLMNAYEFACHAASCRPPGSGGTGGSVGGPGGKSGTSHGRRFLAPAKGGSPSSTTPTGRLQIAKAATPAGTARIVGGKVTVDGKAITGKIVKAGGGYEAKLLGKQHQYTSIPDNKVRQTEVYGSTRAEVARKAHLAVRQYDADIRSQGKKYATVYDKTTNTADARRLANMTSLHVEALAKHGPIKASDVVVGKDGSTKIKGQAQTDIQIQKTYGGYSVSGATTSVGATKSGARIDKVFKTQAAAKAEVAKRVSVASKALAG